MTDNNNNNQITTLGYLRLVNRSLLKVVQIVPYESWTNPWFELPEDFSDATIIRQYQLRLFQFAELIQNIGIGGAILVLSQQYSPLFLAATNGAMSSHTRTVQNFRDTRSGLIIPGLVNLPGVRDPTTGALPQRIKLKDPQEEQIERPLTPAQRVIRGTVGLAAPIPIIGQIGGLIGGLLELLPGVAPDPEPVQQKRAPIDIDAELIETILTEYTTLNITIALNRPKVYNMSIIGRVAQSFSDDQIVQDALAVILGLQNLAQLMLIFSHAFPETTLNRSISEFTIRIQFEPDIVISLFANTERRDIVVLPRHV